MKSTVQSVLCNLIGLPNTTMFNLWDLGGQYGKAHLLGKQVAHVDEINLQGNEKRYMIYEALNSVIGGTLQKIEQKYKDAYTAVIKTRFIMSCNELPTFKDSSGALAERLLIIPHTKSFAGSEDPFLQEKLLAELSGIANWALEGLKRLRERGKFLVPQICKDKLDDFKGDSSPKIQFVKECLKVNHSILPASIPAEKMDTWDFTPKNDLWRLWINWCKDEGIPSGNDRGDTGKVWFIRDLRTALPIKETKPLIDGKQVKGFRGIVPNDAWRKWATDWMPE